MIGRQLAGTWTLLLFTALFGAASGCEEDDGKCKCVGCWDCADVGSDAGADERPDYEADAVWKLVEGVWEGTSPEALNGAPISVRVEITKADGEVSYRAARPKVETGTCEIPTDAADRCAGLRAPARVDVVADPADFSYQSSDVTIYGRTLAVADERPEARSYEGFPTVSWDVQRDGREFNVTLVFAAEGRLWMQVQEGMSNPFVEIGGRE